MRTEGRGEAELPHTFPMLSGSFTFLECQCTHQPGSPWLVLTNTEPHVQSFYWGFITEIWFMKSLATWLNSISSPLPCTEVGLGNFNLFQLENNSVQLLSQVWLFATPRTAAHQASLSITNSQSLFKLMSIDSVMPSNHLILCHPLLLPSIFPSIRVVSNESVLHIRWPKYWSSSFSISPYNESGLISFRMDWLDLAVQGTLKHLLQHHNWKVSILQHSAFFIIQLPPPYMTMEKPQLWLDRPLLAK